jgi:hypothetical protein
MKKIVFATMLALSFSSTAMAWDLFDDCYNGHTDGQCDDDKYFTCSARDGNGAIYTSKSGGFYAENIVQYRAAKACKAQSPVPASCRPLGCVGDYE